MVNLLLNEEWSQAERGYSRKVETKPLCSEHLNKQSGLCKLTLSCFMPKILRFFNHVLSKYISRAEFGSLYFLPKGLILLYS